MMTRQQRSELEGALELLRETNPPHMSRGWEAMRRLENALSRGAAVTPDVLNGKTIAGSCMQDLQPQAVELVIAFTDGTQLRITANGSVTMSMIR